MSERYLGFHINWIEQWSQFIERCNWYDFNPVGIGGEWDRMLGGVEVTVILLGLGFRLRYNYAETEVLEEIRQRGSEILEGYEDE